MSGDEESYKNASITQKSLRIFLSRADCLMEKVSVAQPCSPATPWAVAHQTALCVGSPRRGYWVGCPDLLQRISQTRGLNPGLSHCGQVLCHLSHHRSSGEGQSLSRTPFWPCGRNSKLTHCLSHKTSFPHEILALRFLVISNH